MSNINSLNSSLNWLASTLRFVRNHFVILMALGLIAGIGRVMQLRGFGEISANTHLALELIIQGARILLFVYVLGSASMTHGFRRMAGAFRQNSRRKKAVNLAVDTFKSNWKGMLLNFIAYLAIAWGFNLIIDQLAYETCFYLAMKDYGILSPDSSEWTIILFFKNLTVIPLTLVFNAVFVFYVTGKLKFLHSHPNTTQVV